MDLRVHSPGVDKRLEWFILIDAHLCWYCNHLVGALGLTQLLSSLWHSLDIERILLSILFLLLDSYVMASHLHIVVNLGSPAISGTSSPSSQGSPPALLCHVS